MRTARRAPRPIVALLTAGGIASIVAPACAAHAAARASSRGPAYASTTVAVDSLPQGEVLSIDWTGQPGSLARTARVVGVRVAAPRRSDEEWVVDVGASNEDQRVTSACFDSAQRSGPPASVTESSRWSAMDVATGLSLADGSAGYYRVGQLHIEELVHQPAGVVLRTRDAWLDVVDGGARVHATARLPLRDLVPQGLHLYAGRTGDDVVFVVERTVVSLSVVVSGQVDPRGDTDCAHVAIRMGGKRGMSSTVLVDTVALLPDASSDEVAPPADGSKTEEAPRERAGHVALSWSWEPADPAPLVAVSSGWSSRARPGDGQPFEPRASGRPHRGRGGPRRGPLID